MKPSRLRTCLIFLILLIPSARYAWQNQDMPGFVSLHDDGILFTCAKSLASGQGFRILSLPEQPWQTKYPVLYPLVLSMVWRLNPSFPSNLRLAGLLCWATLAICLALALAFYRQQGFSERRRLILVALLGLSPYLLFFGCGMFSEVFFTGWVLLTLMLSARGDDRQGLALLAGVTAGCAYLTRTAGIGLLVAIPAYYLIRRQRRQALAFTGAMLPFVLGWMLWSHAHVMHASDEMLVSYLDYFKYQAINFRWASLPRVLWTNLDAILFSMGGLAIPKLVNSLPVKILTEVTAIAMIAGIVRMARRGIAVGYALFGAASFALLLIWHFPADERYLLPLFPLLLAGLASELEHFATLIRAAFRHPDPGQRVAAAVFAFGVTAVLGTGLLLQTYISFFLLDESAQVERSKRHDRQAAYTWIQANLPSSAAVLSDDDPLLYLATGRRGSAIFFLPRDCFYSDRLPYLDTYRGIAGLCRRRALAYFYFTSDDLIRWTRDAKITGQVQAAVQDNPDLTPVFHQGIGTLYRVRPAP